MEDITHPALVKALVKNPLDILNSFSLSTIDLWHGATGVAGEAGELLEGIMLYATMNSSISEALENLIEESGDLYFYTEQLTQRTGLELDWEIIDTFARSQLISPDQALVYASWVAIHGSQVLDTVKKAAIYNKELDLHLLCIQLTDMHKFLATLGYMFGFSREQALEHNIAKLSKRYEGVNYSDAAAQLRADKVIERKFIKGESEPVVIRGGANPLATPEE